MYFTYIEIMGHEYPIEIEYDYFGSKKGKRVKGQQIEPDEPHFVEISEVKIDHSSKGEPSDFRLIELPEEVLEMFEPEILEQFCG